MSPHQTKTEHPGMLEDAFGGSAAQLLQSQSDEPAVRLAHGSELFGVSSAPWTL
jgi:hypothetical protein